MKWSDAIDIAQYRPRLLGLMLVGVAAHFIAESPIAPAAYGLLASVLVLILCLLAQLILRHSRHAATGAHFGGVMVASLGIVSAALRLSTHDWQAAVFIALLAIQAGAFIAAASRWHVWLILAAAFTALLCSAMQAHSAWFLPCAACFTCIALDLLILQYRDTREHAVTFATVGPGETRTGGLVFVSTTLLLTIPVYLFVPKPSIWSFAELQSTGPVARVAAAPPPASPPISPISDLDPPPSDVASTSTVPTTTPAHIARPGKGEYGEDFGIADVERRQAFADDIVLLARSSHPVNLRGRIYEHFAAARWSRSSIGPQRIALEDGTLQLTTALRPTLVQQTIDIKRELDPTLIHAPGIQRVRFPAVALLRYEDGMLAATEPLRAGTVYSIESRLELREGRYLLREPQPADLTPYLQVDGASARVHELARSVTTGAASDLARALALEQYLRTHYAYSYETIAQQNFTPLDWFLFEGKRGHCEFFASALAMLLRSVGIPARVTTGFVLTQPNPITGFYEVRELDGHAWVEAFLDDEGWLMLEPTPFYPLPVAKTGRSIAAQLDSYLERRATIRELLAPDTMATRSVVLVRDMWRGLREGQRMLTQKALQLGWRLPLLLLAIAAALLVSHLIWMAATDWLDNLRIRRSLEALPSDQRAATLSVAATLLHTLTPRYLARRPDWTLQEYAEELRRTAGEPDLPAIPAEFMDAFDAARYGATATANTAQALAPVVALIRERLVNHAWPRLHAALARWRRVMPRIANVRTG